MSTTDRTVICPCCAPHVGHAPGKCPGDKRDGPKRKPCKCKAESRHGKSRFVVRSMHGTYFQGAVGALPRFGAKKPADAFQFENQVQLREEMARWPVVAAVGCAVEAIPR